MTGIKIVEQLLKGRPYAYQGLTIRGGDEMKRRTICASAPFKSIPIEGKPNHYYEASIYYAKGGMNYLSGESVQRGYLEFSHAYLAKAYEKKVGRA